MIRLESKRDRTVLYLATTVAVLLLFLMGLLPLFETFKGINGKISTKQKELDENTKLLNRSQKIYKPMLNEWRKAGINRQSDNANIITNQLVSTLSTNLGLRFDISTMSMNVRTNKNRDYPQNTIRARGTCSYHQILTLLYHLGKDENPLRVTEIDLSAKDDNQQFCTVSMVVATTFFVQDTRKTGRSSASGSVTSEVQP